MKTLLSLSIFLFVVVFSAAAQDLQDLPRPQTTAAVADEAVREGNWLVGANIGNIGYNFESNNFGIDINPRAGYFLSVNAAIGAEVQLGLSIYDGGEEFRYGLTPFARYYFPEGAAPTHRWFAEVLAGFAGSSLEDSEDDASLSSVLGIRAGYAHFVSDNVAIEGILGYTSTNADISVGNGSSGLNLGIGLQIYLPGRNNR
ncbi:outer membrane beta-barrel protein [Pontibacter sp. E15-1]|uniref:outer membrane beta-barrel protein n=1 Tax=Pontibacter sp. E15-1 TaxID=2919918 RepID=UPI001F4F6E0D|nr:outer membrane beta-barrel protein [Pontibacter sp. E15-1]MCJ8166272.1 outer membrane beta-barrel protein [Pontibacter sp. E15-1]